MAGKGAAAAAEYSSPGRADRAVVARFGKERGLSLNVYPGMSAMH